MLGDGHPVALRPPGQAGRVDLGADQTGATGKHGTDVHRSPKAETRPYYVAGDKSAVPISSAPAFHART